MSHNLQRYDILAHNLALIFTLLFQANITLNKGKDFTEDTLEMIVRGPPASFSVIEGSEYEFWRRGAKTFLTEELVSFIPVFFTLNYFTMRSQENSVKVFNKLLACSNGPRTNRREIMANTWPFYLPLT